MSINWDRESVRCCASRTLEMWRCPQHMTFFLSAGSRPPLERICELHWISWGFRPWFLIYLFLFNYMHIIWTKSYPWKPGTWSPCHPAKHHTKMMLTASKKRSIKATKKEPSIWRTNFCFDISPVSKPQISLLAIRFFVVWSRETRFLGLWIGWARV